MRLLIQVICCLSFFFLFSCHRDIHPVFEKKSQMHYSHSWKKLKSYPIQSGRNDDLHFFNLDRGFVISSHGKLLLTEDGGETWELKFEKEEKSFFRCLTFKDSLHGWLGTLGPGDQALPSRDSVSMYATKDGGNTWAPVVFEGPYPKGLCGLQTVSDQVIVGCGRVRGPSFFVKSMDGGASWQSFDLNHLAGSLIAPYFYDEQHGILVGGTTHDKKNSHSLVLETTDGGESWDTLYLSEQKGEYPWKVVFPTDKSGFISIQRNVKDGRFYVLQTEDGGKTWFENVYINEPLYVQGIGFLNDQVGWMGGSPSHTMETRDGGKTWLPMADVGRGFNKFQFFNNGSGYGTGYGVFKMDSLRSLPDGVVENFAEDGTHTSSISYRKGKLHGKALHFYTHGKIQRKGKLKNNLRQGTWKFYKDNGKLDKKIKYRQGLAMVSKEKMMDYVGEYQLEEGVFRTITFSEGKFYSRHSQANNRFEILPISDDEFIYDDGRETKIRFVRDENRKVIHHLLRTRNGRESKAIKL